MRKFLLLLTLVLGSTMVNAQNLELDQLVDLRAMEIEQFRDYVTDMNWVDLHNDYKDKYGPYSFFYEYSESNVRTPFIQYLPNENEKNRFFLIRTNDGDYYNHLLKTIDNTDFKLTEQIVVAGDNKLVYQNDKVSIIFVEISNSIEEDNSLSYKYLITIMHNKLHASSKK